MGEADRAAEAVEEALRAAGMALARVTGWCEAVGQEAARRHGPGPGEWADPAHIRALGVRGLVADAIRKLERASGQLRQAREQPGHPRPTGQQPPQA